MSRPIEHDGVVYRREGTKFWWMCYRERNGNRQRESTFTEDWQEAHKSYARGFEARDGNILQVVRKGENLNFGEWADFFLENYSKPPVRQPGTHKANLRCVQHLKKAFATRRLVDVGLTRSSTTFVIGFVSGSGSKLSEGYLEQGTIKTNHCSSGIPGASTDVERGRSKEAADIEPMCDGGISGHVERGCSVRIMSLGQNSSRSKTTQCRICGMPSASSRKPGCE